MSEPREPMKRTALVTGASSGIGEAFAERLAGQRYDLVLVARRAERLEQLASRLTAEHGIGCEVLVADLTKREQLAKVEERLRDEAKPILLLVNNAGFGTVGAFSELDIEREEKVVQLNVIAVMRLAHAALPGMKARGRGAIINVSSVAGFAPGGLNSTYAATKAFVTSFTETLAIELRGTGVRMQALCPGFTRTEFQETAGIVQTGLPSFAWDEIDPVVRASLNGLRRNQVVVVPTLKFRLMVWLIKFSPRSLVRSCSGFIARRHRAATQKSG